MAEKLCANCGELNSAESNFCSSCGASEFKEVPPGLSARLSAPFELAATSAVRLSTGRVATASILSFGLYFFYWFYLTWKQLASETNENHYPVWHALTLFVPIYNLFRIYRHMTVIKELAVRAGLTASLSPGWAVVLVIIISALDNASFRTTDVGVAVVLGVLSTAIATALIVWAQGNLNQYWEKVKGANLREARIGIGEVIIVLVGLLAWVGTFLPAE